MTKENRKVKGAVECEIDGVRVRSHSEREMPTLLKEAFGTAFADTPLEHE